MYIKTVNDTMCPSDPIMSTGLVMERLFIVNWGTSEKGARSVIFSIDWNRNTTLVGYYL